MMYKGLHGAFSDDEIIYVDIRKGAFPLDRWERKPIIVEPTVVADLKRLPFKDGCFNLILFDPPHGNFSLDTFMGVKYGGLTETEFTYLIVWANREFWRVLKPGGVVFAKVMDNNNRYKRLLRAFVAFKPLLDIDFESKGHHALEWNRTHWILFVRRDDYVP